ncbi:MAG: 2-phospho-L-lactate transferase [Acidimicrobiia bacterium]
MPRVVLLAGGVGGARAARGFAAVLGPADFTVVGNVGDDDWMYGVHVSPDLDTIVYTLAGLEGPEGWGRADDTFAVMAGLEQINVDTTFRLGDNDLAVCLARTRALDEDEPLSLISDRIGALLGVQHQVLPATDDRLRTRIHARTGEWMSFQEYFVLRGQQDEVAEVVFDGADHAHPAPYVLDAITGADLVVIAPSNPILSIWPILAVGEIAEAVGEARRVIAVSPLFGGKALKGPADRVMKSLGLQPGTAGILEAYRGLLTDLVVDIGDAEDAGMSEDVRIHALDTRIAEPKAAERFATEVLAL